MTKIWAPNEIRQQLGQSPDSVRVERDVRDGSKDYFIHKDTAKALYEAGKLHWDILNGCYIEVAK